MKAILVGKGKSLDNAKPEWFGTNEPIWCLNQATDVICKMLPDRKIVCVQNDGWINYMPPKTVTWYCYVRVPVGNHPNVRYYKPEILTGNWASPTCVCALHLLKDAGFDEVTMIGFDSHFDDSLDYAESIGVKSNCNSSFAFYDTIMRRYAQKNGIRLTWIDKNGMPHADDYQFTKAIVAVAMGAQYTKQTDGMIASFLKYNPDWKVCKYYDDALQKILPPECRTWTPFDKCEIGRWYAMKLALHQYDTIVYADGDIRWYNQYVDNPDHAMTLFPHYVSQRQRQNCKHQLLNGGTANIGIMELHRATETEGVYDNAKGVFDFVIGETMKEPSKFKIGNQLWLQKLVSMIPECGYDCVYNYDAGYDVAWWNIRKGDREILDIDGKLMVRTTDEKVVPLRSVHFSSKSLNRFEIFGGDICRKLIQDYKNGK